MTSTPVSTGDAELHPREVLGLRLPVDLPCWRCQTFLISHICWDTQRQRLCCIRCARLIARSRPDTIKTVTLDVRGRLNDVDYIPAAQAIALLMRHGASVI